MKLYVEYQPEWPDDGLGLWAVWDEDSDWPEPLYEGVSFNECAEWIERSYPLSPPRDGAQGKPASGGGRNG